MRDSLMEGPYAPIVKVEDDDSIDVRKLSRVDTIYIYERVHQILDMDDLAEGLSRLHNELAHNFYIDTGRKVGEVLFND
jgi:uncharacterized membrane protein YjjP (DUF1212 family)|tara:strand:+ start:162 stop:398 length:237 start_codon:yes stop_codon:yes gene_type:complete